MSIGIHQLRCFAAVADHGHVTRAAASLYISQPALSAQIRALESAAGCSLFERHPKGMELTPAGQAFLVHARVCLAEFENAMESARAAARGASSVVRVGIIVGTQVDVISHVLRTFRSAAPRTRIEFVEHTFEVPSAGLTAGDVDIAFVVLPMHTEGLEVLPLAQASLVAALPGDHALAGRDDLSIEEILDEPWMVTDTPDDICRAYWQASAHRTKDPIIHHRVKTMDKFVQLVAAGEVVGIAPAWIVQYYDGQSVSFIPVRDVSGPTIALAWRETERSRPAILQMQAAARAAVALSEKPDGHVGSGRTAGTDTTGSGK